MLSTRWQPLWSWQSELGRLHEEMDRLFQGRGSGRQALSPTGYPLLNVWEDEDHLFVEAELPGMELSDLEIYVQGNQLTIKGERKAPEAEQGTWHRQERGYGSFSRVMELPAEIDDQRVAADFRHGVLTVSLPKREETKPRRIEVRVD